MRNKGAIIYANAVATEYKGRAGNPGGRHEPAAVLPSTLGYQRSSWSGNPSGGSEGAMADPGPRWHSARGVEAICPAMRYTVR